MFAIKLSKLYSKESKFLAIVITFIKDKIEMISLL